MVYGIGYDMTFEDIVRVTGKDEHVLKKELIDIEWRMYFMFKSKGIL